MRNSTDHDHQHKPNRFAVIPTHIRLSSNELFTGKGVTIAFLDSGFYPHPDLTTPENRILAYQDVTNEGGSLNEEPKSWHWHGTQTTVVAAGNGRLADGTYRGLANEAQLALVKVSERGHITEDNIARGISWVIENRERYKIRVLNISLGGDEDVPCSKSVIDQLAEEAVKLGIVVVVAAGNSDGNHSIPPANAPSVITVGGYGDRNQLGHKNLDLYHSNFGATADGTVKPELLAPAMFVAAPILPNTADYDRAESLSKLVFAADYELPALIQLLKSKLDLPDQVVTADADSIRRYIEATLQSNKIVASHYQHVDGTSFAAPIASSIVAQMIQANPSLTPASIKSILIGTADRIADVPGVRQGFGIVNAKHAVAAALNEKHALEFDASGSPRVENGLVKFSYHDDRAETVALAGDFNSWSTSATLLRRDRSGLWLTEISAPVSGRYEYKFLVNGQRWIEDPSNAMKVPDKFGGLNSLLVIA